MRARAHTHTHTGCPTYLQQEILGNALEDEILLERMTDVLCHVLGLLPIAQVCAPAQ